MSLVLIVCAALAFVAALLTTIFMPRTSGTQEDTAGPPIPLHAEQ